MGMEDPNQEVAVANEVDLAGSQDSKLQLPDLMISSTDRRKQACAMMGATRKVQGKQKRKLLEESKHHGASERPGKTLRAKSARTNTTGVIE